MSEIEVKVLNIDVDEIEKKLIDIGAVLIKDENQINIRFDTNDNFLKKEYKGYMRVRKTIDNISGKITNTLTIKRNISREEVRVNEEIETEVVDIDAMIMILETLNFVKKKPGRKHRKSYKYENILFEIDSWDKTIYPKPYLEIEVLHEKDIDRAINLLGIDKKNISVKSIDELVKDL